MPDSDFSFEAVVLLHIAVDQQFQGQGFGQALIQNVINRFTAEEQPNSPKLLLVQAEQISLRKWYQNMGFNPLPTKLPILFLSRT
jgi:ribosomal protein S18 acetylase RimI-like enzyme